MSDDKSPTSLFIFNDQSPEKKHYDFNFALPPPTAPSPQVQPMDVDTSGPIKLPEELSDAQIASEKKQKLNSGKVRRKIRKLTSIDESLSRKHESGWLCQLGGIRSIMVCSFVILVIAVLVGIFAKDDLRKDFYKMYRNHHQLLLYGVEDYCLQELDFSNVTKALKARVVGQQLAVDQISDFFNRHRDDPYSSLALSGPVGVGKSLTAELIGNNFQWRSNVHRFTWGIAITAEQQFSNFQSFLYSLRNGASTELNCGHNLLIIDNLEATDAGLVNKINNRLKFVSEKDNVQLTALFVFQGASAGDSSCLRGLNGNIEQVTLRSLTENDLEQCIRLEAKELGVDLGEDTRLVNIVMSSVDVHRYGCKGVRAKVSLYS
ncbi:uncharacterized protein LOC131685562 [Topomyia yanbarensis]|uniref:uncharacterized protein LOC131685562 n=1 Tax=Topomyia yanbarensis TaxID=2498891 RepID=UPI00273AA030|nr:uncharacterized protein LOC131685562 [Topomyia yanbarensis]